MILSFFAICTGVFVNSQVSSLRKNLLLIKVSWRTFELTFGLSDFSFFLEQKSDFFPKNEFWNFARFIPRWEVFLAIISFNCFLSRNWGTHIMTTHSSTHLPTHTDNSRLRRSPIWVITELRRKKIRLFIPESSFAMKNWIKTLLSIRGF